MDRLANPERKPVGDMLREWRTHRRLSQMSLALDSGISARHLSFLETGRSQPSREMLLRLANKLDVPLRERNRMLTAAGFAPMYAERPFGDPRLDAARAAVEAVLAAHEPFPALALDRHWNLLAANRAALRLIDGVAPELLQPPINAMRLALHPRGLAPRTLNLAEWRSHMLARLARQIELAPDVSLQALLDELRAHPAPAPAETSRVDGAEIFVPLRLQSAVGELCFLSTSTVFGTAQEITLSELVIEAFLPANAETGERLRALSGAA